MVDVSIVMEKTPNQQIEKQIGQYILQITNPIGEGASGMVYKCVEEGNDELLLACKVIPKEFVCANVEDIEREKEILKELPSGYFCQTHCICESVNNLYIITEFCNQGTLKQYAERYKPDMIEIMRIFRDVVRGYKALNELNIVHRDIKLENILMKHGSPKIVDFGYSRYIPPDKVIFLCYMYDLTNIFVKKDSLVFTSPQSLIRSGYTYKNDIFSLGMVLYVLVNNLQWPRNFVKEEDVMKWHQSLGQGDPSSVQFKSNVPHSIRELILKMFKYCEEERISIEQLEEETSAIYDQLMWNNDISNQFTQQG